MVTQASPSLILGIFLIIIIIIRCSGMFRDVPECSGMFHVPGFIDGQFTLLLRSLIQLFKTIGKATGVKMTGKAVGKKKETFALA